jgi:hypothetical protein
VIPTDSTEATYRFPALSNRTSIAFVGINIDKYCNQGSEGSGKNKEERSSSGN